MGPLHSAHPFALTHDPKPTIVLVPDAWFPSAAYGRLLGHLEQRDFPVEGADLPSLARLTPSGVVEGFTNASTTTDASFLRQILLRIIEREGRDLVLLTHGYGSRSALSAGRALHKATRFRDDLPGGVLGVITISPVILFEGTRLELEGNCIPSWAVRDSPQPGLCRPTNVQENLASGCNVAAARDCLSSVRPASNNAFESIQPPTLLDENDYQGCLAAIVTTEDQALDVSIQEHLLRSSGRNWRVQRMPCSHMAPVIDRCADVAHLVEYIVEAFEQRLDERWMAETNGQ